MLDTSEEVAFLYAWLINSIEVAIEQAYSTLDCCEESWRCLHLEQCPVCEQIIAEEIAYLKQSQLGDPFRDLGEIDLDCAHFVEAAV